MPGRIILSFAALVLFAAGAITLFAPQELARALEPTANGAVVTAIQASGSGLLGFALLDWMSTGNRIGGIFSRPLAMGNLLLFATAALSVLKSAGAGSLPPPSIGLGALLAIVAASFVWLAFVHDPLGHRDVPSP